MFGSDDGISGGLPDHELCSSVGFQRPDREVLVWACFVIESEHLGWGIAGKAFHLPSLKNGDTSVVIGLGLGIDCGHQFPRAVSGVDSRIADQPSEAVASILDVVDPFGFIRFTCPIPPGITGRVASSDKCDDRGNRFGLKHRFPMVFDVVQRHAVGHMRSQCLVASEVSDLGGEDEGEGVLCEFEASANEQSVQGVPAACAPGIEVASLEVRVDRHGSATGKRSEGWVSDDEVKASGVAGWRIEQAIGGDQVCGQRVVRRVVR